eukprot:COSAG06_NODE_24811_length_652_cov_0.667269_1_plen_127_part_01
MRWKNGSRGSRQQRSDSRCTIILARGGTAYALCGRTAIDTDGEARHFRICSSYHATQGHGREGRHLIRLRCEPAAMSTLSCAATALTHPTQEGLGRLRLTQTVPPGCTATPATAMRSGSFYAASPPA